MFPPRTIALAATGILLLLPATSSAQEGVVERLGRQVDRGVEQLADRVQRSWAEIKASVERLEVEGRVYSRLHWDERLTGHALDIEVSDKGIVVLKGTVPSPEAQVLAVELAQHTVGVTQVIDQLAVVEVATQRVPRL